METDQLSALPGAELVRKGLADAAAGIESVEALLVHIGAPKLRSLGIDVPASPHGSEPPEHRLYRRLSLDNPNAAHGRYNALLGRLVSFERALACGSR